MSTLKKSPHHRINVIGTSASGKSTFSQALAKQLDIPYIEMDALFWKPNWQHPTDEEFFAKLQQAISANTWVLDGNYSRTMAFKWQQVNMVIWIDYGFFRTLYQAISRTLNRCWTKKELWPETGNKESFRKAFFNRDSILWWMLKNYYPNKKKIKKWMESDDYSHIQFVRLSSPAEARAFLESAIIENG
ncbi:adenylate kinase [Pleionea sp. CnH1-48]|uniref:adenylate kinase n=1 Tax=Pleionea sp. CnH1-48 TaxID=2954494 RepID=UPI002097E976|nr:adenylate kinase [Pleionea sp. CnH1-48]MCO7223747.1 adenylate kinase [Pleionea sp. CnH1-48]